VGIAPLALGGVLSDRYALQRELGRGGMATVYLARDLQESRLVALKVLRPEVAAALGTERFLREIRLTAQLQHLHILGLLDSGEVEGCLYYTLPYVAGESLRGRLVRQPQLPIDEALRIATEVAQALAYAHAQGVVHRDIKPENILLERTETGARALVADFGIAQALDLAGGERLTATGLAIGTPAYMSPEQASGSRVDRRSDLYSLGCVLYEMLGGEPPYTGPTGQAINAKRLKAPIPHLRALRPEVPPAVEHAVTRALAKSPVDRFLTAEQFTAALVPAPPVATVRLRRWRVRRTTALVFGLLLFGAAVVGGAVLLRHRSPTAAPAVSATARRVVVAVFANQTGDASLDPLGDIVADYLSRGLAETKLVEVIDARAEQSGNSSAVATGNAGARSLAHDQGGGSVLWGAYARQGDSLRFEAQLTDAATGEPLAAIPPAAGSAGQQTRGVEALRQHVMSALAERFDPRLARFVDVSASHAVSYDAYREFLAGDTIQVYGGCDPCVAMAMVHYRRAYALDTNFTLPLVQMAGISAFAGPCERTDSIADVLRPRHDRLPPFDRLQLDWVVAKCHGQPERVLKILREAMAVAPRSDVLVSRYARMARLAGRLHEAITMTERLDPKRHERDLFYWGNRAIAYHLLGEHQRELALAQEARRVLPGNMEVLGWEVHALVGLGRLADVNALVDEAARVPLEVPQVQSGLLSFLKDVGRDLRAHGYPEPARAVFERGIRWIKARPAAEQRDRGLQADLSGLLYDAERWDEARAVLDRLAAETPDEMDVQAALGAVAARRGDLKEVARIDRWLARRTGRYLNGEHTFNRARLAAILGDRDRAVELYRLALEQGYALGQGGYFGHADPDFESLLDYPPFQELTRPED
jgi:serine/threonine-protein kinase